MELALKHFGRLVKDYKENKLHDNHIHPWSIIEAILLCLIADKQRDIT